MSPSCKERLVLLACWYYRCTLFSDFTPTHANAISCAKMSSSTNTIPCHPSLLLSIAQICPETLYYDVIWMLYTCFAQIWAPVDTLSSNTPVAAAAAVAPSCLQRTACQADAGAARVYSQVPETQDRNGSRALLSTQQHADPTPSPTLTGYS